MPRRTALEIRCTGRKVNRFSNKPYGRTCGRVFTSKAAYRSRATWIERARAAGWRISPLLPDRTVTAFCPTCVTGKTNRTPRTEERNDNPLMDTLSAREQTLIELRAAVKIDDKRVEIERTTILGEIRARLAAASPGPWYVRKDRDGSIRVRRTGCVSYSRIASLLRSGQRPAEDGELIGHAPTDLAYLLDEIDRVRAERDVLLKHATYDGQLAYWTVRAEARGQETTARIAAKTARR